MMSFTDRTDNAALAINRLTRKSCSSYSKRASVSDDAHLHFSSRTNQITWSIIELDSSLLASSLLSTWSGFCFPAQPARGTSRNLGWAQASGSKSRQAGTPAQPALKPGYYPWETKRIQKRSLTMTLNYPLDSCDLFQCVYVLSIVAKQFSFFIRQGYEFVAQRWLKLSRIYFLYNTSDRNKDY